MRDSIGLLLFAFQIACYGTLGHPIPVPYQIEDSILEEHRIVKRSVCTPDQLNEASLCGSFNLCETSLESQCSVTCGLCQLPPPTTPAPTETTSAPTILPVPPPTTPAPTVCTPDQINEASICGSFNLCGTSLESQCSITCGLCQPPTPTTAPPETTSAPTILPVYTPDQLTEASLCGRFNLCETSLESQCSVTCGLCQQPTTSAPKMSVSSTSAPTTSTPETSMPTTSTPETPVTTPANPQSVSSTSAPTTAPPPTTPETSMPTTSTPAIPTTPAIPLTPDEAACLEAHNAKRALHNAQPLVWDAALAVHASEWADHLFLEGELEHAQGISEGENLFRASGSIASTCVDAVEAWYSEISHYDFDNPGFSLATSHFTQLVWKDTKQVGVGVVVEVNRQGELDTYIVARYSPPGNIDGQYAQNVGPLGSKVNRAMEGLPRCSSVRERT